MFAEVPKPSEDLTLGTPDIHFKLYVFTAVNVSDWHWGLSSWISLAWV